MPGEPPVTRDRAEALARVPLPPDMIERLEVYEHLLRRWQRIDNLVAPASLDHIWLRHFADSAQILDLMPQALRWVDLGSGAGFPGLVVAILLSGRPGAEVHLIESNRRKCAFLRDVSRETSSAGIIHSGRAETIAPTLTGIEVVTARALAPLAKLIAYADPLLKKGASGLFLKGQNVSNELTELPPLDNFNVTLAASKTDPSGRIVVITPTDMPISDGRSR